MSWGLGWGWGGHCETTTFRRLSLSALQACKRAPPYLPPHPSPPCFCCCLQTDERKIFVKPVWQQIGCVRRQRQRRRRRRLQNHLANVWCGEGEGGEGNCSTVATICLSCLAPNWRTFSSLSACVWVHVYVCVYRSEIGCSSKIHFQLEQQTKGR